MANGNTDMIASSREQNAAIQTAPSKRIAPIDFMRGLCVIGMVSWHILSDSVFPKSFSFCIIQPFNFVAEGFVLLAGASVGLAAARPAVSRRPTRRYLQRAGNLLAVHYAIVASLIVLCDWGLIDSPRPAATATELTWSIATLTFQPYLADVLTVFVFLFALTPCILCISRRFGDAALLSISTALYTVVVLLYAMPEQSGWLAFEPNQQGAFDVGSWQLVYVVGILVGAHWDAIQRSVHNRFSRLAPAAVLLFGITAAFRLGAEAGYLEVPERLRGILLERHPLGTARLAYVFLQLAIIGMLTIKYWQGVQACWPVRITILFGRCSLSVFVASVFMDYFLKAMIACFHPSFAFAAACWLSELVALLLMAKLVVYLKSARPVVA